MYIYDLIASIVIRLISQYSSNILFNSSYRVHNNGECCHARFDLSVLGGCGEHPYGYVVDYPSNNVISPCFLLKLNKELIFLYRKAVLAAVLIHI